MEAANIQHPAAAPVPVPVPQLPKLAAAAQMPKQAADIICLFYSSFSFYDVFVL
jgi:hypothetical protein